MRSPLLLAFMNPLNLAMLALAVAAGLCAAWWLFPLGLLVWGLMFFILYRDPGMQLDQVIGARTALAARFQKQFDQIQRVQISLFNSLSSTRPGVRAALQPVQEAVNQLTDQSYRLCQRMTVLENHRLVIKSNRDLEGELFVIKTKLDNITDPMARGDYEESQRALEERLKNFRAMTTLLDRVEAQLASIFNTVDNALTESVRLQVKREAEIRSELPRILQPIQLQSTQLANFEAEADRTKV